MHQEGRTPTQYSNIFDLNSGHVYIYYFHDFTTFKKINLKTELEKGRKVYDIPALFSE